MSFSRPTLLHAALAALLPALCLAAEPPAAPKPEAAKPNVVVTGETSRVSNNLASSITSTLPKYQPPPPPSAPKHEDPAVAEVAEEVDDPDHPAAEGQPRNKIIRLPKYVVQAERPPIFTDRELNSKKGLAKLAARRYISSLDKNVLNRFTLPIIGTSAEQRALMMYEEDERLGNISDLKEDANNAARAGDSAEATSIRRETNRAYMRSGGMDWTMPKD
jgi:hypothetical protein